MELGLTFSFICLWSQIGCFTLGQGLSIRWSPERGEDREREGEREVEVRRERESERQSQR